MKYGSCLVNVVFRVVEARLHRPEVQVEDLLLLGKLLAQPALHHPKIDLQQLRHRAHVHHVLDQLAQLGLRANRRA